MVYAARRLTRIEFSVDPYTFTAIIPGAYPGEAKMYLRLLDLGIDMLRDSREVANALSPVQTERVEAAYLQVMYA